MWISSTEGTAQLKYRHDLKDNEAEFEVERKYRRRKADHNFWQIFRCKLFEKSGVCKTTDVSAGYKKNNSCKKVEYVNWNVH